MDDPMRVDPHTAIPLAEVELRTSRSSGPGGQHANVTASRVEAIFDAAASPAWARPAPPGVARCGPRVTAVAQDTRSQARNRELALERLRSRLAAALRQQRKRRSTRPTRASKERRLEGKKRRSDDEAEAEAAGSGLQRWATLVRPRRRRRRPAGWSAPAGARAAAGGTATAARGAAATGRAATGRAAARGAARRPAAGCTAGRAAGGPAQCRHRVPKASGSWWCPWSRWWSVGLPRRRAWWEPGLGRVGGLLRIVAAAGDQRDDDDQDDARGERGHKAAAQVDRVVLAPVRCAADRGRGLDVVSVGHPRCGEGSTHPAVSPHDTKPCYRAL